MVDSNNSHLYPIAVMIDELKSVDQKKRTLVKIGCGHLSTEHRNVQQHYRTYRRHGSGIHLLGEVQGSHAKRR